MPSRSARAALRLVQHDPDAATAALAPVLDGSVFVSPSTWLAHAFMLQAIAQDALGRPAAADRAVGRALDLAGPVGALSPFLLNPAPGLLQRHARQSTRHATLIAEIRSLLPAAHGTAGPHDETAPSGARADAAEPAPRLIEPLSQSEIRVLRYMPTNLSAPEIARELYLSVHTVRTHIRHVFVKLGTHSRTEAVARARALGLLAPSPSPRAQAPIPDRGSNRILLEKNGIEWPRIAGSFSLVQGGSRQDGGGDFPAYCACRRRAERERDDGRTDFEARRHGAGSLSGMPAAASSRSAPGPAGSGPGCNPAGRGSLVVSGGASRLQCLRRSPDAGAPLAGTREGIGIAVPAGCHTALASGPGLACAGGLARGRAGVSGPVVVMVMVSSRRRRSSESLPGWAW